MGRGTAHSVVEGRRTPRRLLPAYPSPPYKAFTLARSICPILVSGVGNYSGMVPHSSATVLRTFLPTA